MSYTDFADIAPYDRYRLLTATVIPRPIAWVTTIGADGIVNAAPFSFFNVFSEDPALLVLGLQHHPDRTRKDTTRNIEASGDCVVNLVTTDLMEAMVATAAAYGPEVGEPERLGIATASSVKVAPPRIAAAPVAFECRREVGLTFGPGRQLLVSEVLAMHARDGLVDAETGRVEWGADLPVARLYGNTYAILDQEVEIPVPKPT